MPSILFLIAVLVFSACSWATALAQGTGEVSKQKIRPPEVSASRAPLLHDRSSGMVIRSPRVTERLPPIENFPLVAGDSLVSNRLTPETLDQAWSLAFEADHRLKERESGIDMAAIQLDRARRDRWPNLTMDGAYAVRDHARAFTFQNPALPPGSVFNYQQPEDFSFKTRVDFPLYTSGRIRYAIEAASAGLDASSLNLEETRRRLKLGVAEVYVAVLRAQSGLRVAKSRVLSLDAHLKKVEVLRANDRVPLNDLLAAQVEHSQARQEEIHTWHQLEASRAAYNRLVGRPLATPVLLVELPSPPISAEVKELTEEAMRNRPELALVLAQIRQVQGQADSRRAAGKPQLGLLGQYDFQENQYQRFEGSTSLAVGLTWNAWDAGRTQLDAARLSSQMERLAHHRADLSSQIALDVRRAWLDVQETRHRIEVAQGAVGRAEENLRVVILRYGAGTEIGSVVLDAQSLLSRTQGNHSNAIYDSVLAGLRLRFATGNL